MIIHLLAVGKQMPSWVKTGYEEYAKRFPPHCQLQLHEIESSKRFKNNEIQAKEDEGKKIIDAIPKGSLTIALDIQGKAWSTEDLALRLNEWQMAGRDISLVVGGPNGISAECLAACQQKWSLSPLTFPHPLVRIIVAEQLYRALSITQSHPYHRG